MKIMPVCSYGNRQNLSKNNNIKYNIQPTFSGTAGKVAGILLGGGVAVGLAIITAPVLVCAAPTLGVIGAIAGDEFEKKITNNDNNDKK